MSEKRPFSANLLFVIDLSVIIKDIILDNIFWGRGAYEQFTFTKAQFIIGSLSRDELNLSY
jgi:hypothetical protein